MIPALLPPRTRRAHGLALVFLPVGAIVILEDGTRWRVQPAGELDLIYEGGRPHGGVAEDPAIGGRPRRYP